MKKLTKKLRHELKKPFGELLNEEEFIAKVEENGKLIAIGDICVLTLLKHGLEADISVFDLRSNREPLSEEDADKVTGAVGMNASTVINPAGYITEELETAVKKVIEEGKGNIFVDGEEDLAALIAIAYAENGIAVVYGQPDKGIVLVEIDEKIRNIAKGILADMELVK